MSLVGASSKIVNYLHPLTKLEKRRRKCLISSFPTTLLPLISQPIWGADTRLSDIEFLVLDFETTGLDPMRDNILSMGWVVVRYGKIRMDSACRVDVFSEEMVKPETVVINHIVPEMLAHGEHLDLAMSQLLVNLKGRVLVAHEAAIERGFIHQYCRRVYGLPSLPLVWLDTLKIEKSLMKFSHGNLNADCRLSAARARYGLPSYPGHDALIDSVAAGELFLAQIVSVFGVAEAHLGPMFRRSLS